MGIIVDSCDTPYSAFNDPWIGIRYDKSLERRQTIGGRTYHRV